MMIIKMRFVAQENKDRERIIDYLHKEFHWPYGLFLITDMSFSLNGPGNASTLNQNNIGMKRQWQLSWSPVSMQEVNFVFEDDLEVYHMPYIISPHVFFLTRIWVENRYLPYIFTGPLVRFKSIMRAIRDNVIIIVAFCTLCFQQPPHLRKSSPFGLTLV